MQEDTSNYFPFFSFWIIQDTSTPRHCSSCPWNARALLHVVVCGKLSNNIAMDQTDESLSYLLPCKKLNLHVPLWFSLCCFLVLSMLTKNLAEDQKLIHPRLWNTNTLQIMSVSVSDYCWHLTPTRYDYTKLYAIFIGH